MELHPYCKHNYAQDATVAEQQLAHIENHLYNLTVATVVVVSTVAIGAIIWYFSPALSSFLPSFIIKPVLFVSGYMEEYPLISKIAFGGLSALYSWYKKECEEKKTTLQTELTGLHRFLSLLKINGDEAEERKKILENYKIKREELKKKYAENLRPLLAQHTLCLIQLYEIKERKDKCNQLRRAAIEDDPSINTAKDPSTIQFQKTLLMLEQETLIVKTKAIFYAILINKPSLQKPIEEVLEFRFYGSISRLQVEKISEKSNPVKDKKPVDFDPLKDTLLFLNGTRYSQSNLQHILENQEKRQKFIEKIELAMAKEKPRRTLRRTTI